MSDIPLLKVRDRYSYATMPLNAVIPLLCVPAPKESYISDDRNSRALRELLFQGYRWIRTDGDICVFERKNTRSA